MSNPTKKKNEPKRWLDDPQNVKKIIRGFYWLCGLVIVVDLIFSVVWHKHAIFKQEKVCTLWKPYQPFMVSMDSLPVSDWSTFRN